MTIPVRNLYYLLLYAWGHFAGGATVTTGIDESPDLPNLFGRILLDGTHRLLRRGLDRGYLETTEYTRSPRGRFRFDRMARELTFLSGIAVCDADELTADVLHNQILLATLMSLASCKEVEKDLRHELRATALRMGQVASIRLSAELFHRVQLSRNNAHYGLLLKICEFVYWSMMPDERGATSRFMDILEDEVRMSAVFEEFLRKFYQIEQSQYRVRAEIMRWQITAPTSSDTLLLPVMKTDLTLRSDAHTVIADAKYYRKPLGGAYGERVRSGHLYQLVTYLAHERAAGTSERLSGLLLYPQVGGALHLEYELLGFPITLATIDLGQDWRDIHDDLVRLLTTLS
jgi:5-methylcytosine-specific restriction enzyme subunit McrC